MKKIILLLGLVSAFAFTSCDDNDGYSLDNYWIGMATVDKISDSSNDFYLILDNGDKLWPAATNLPLYNPKDGQRVVANYTILSDGNNRYDHDIKLNDVYQVLTKPVMELTQANADSIGNDPLRVIDAWVGSDYLNIEFEYPGYNKRHMVNLVYSDLFDNGGDAVNLQFRQNGYGDEKRYWYRGIVSFDLTKLKKEGQTSVKLKVSSTDQNGTVSTFDVSYDWSNKAAQVTKTVKNLSNFVEVK